MEFLLWYPSLLKKIVLQMLDSLHYRWTFKRWREIDREFLIELIVWWWFVHPKTNISTQVKLVFVPFSQQLDSLKTKTRNQEIEASPTAQVTSWKRSFFIRLYLQAPMTLTPISSLLDKLTFKLDIGLKQRRIAFTFIVFSCSLLGSRKINM